MLYLLCVFQCLSWYPYNFQCSLFTGDIEQIQLFGHIGPGIIVGDNEFPILRSLLLGHRVIPFEGQDEEILTEQSESYITHIDHEYIFYSLDEFEKRTMNEHQKGSNQLRLKSFKVDNAHIPFSLNYYVTWKDEKGKQLPEVSVPFICYVLNCYFKHTDLLREYFLGV